MMIRNRKIWIDLENSPHVPFFKPIIEEFQKRGHPVIVTARDCFQVCGLADRINLNYTRIGHHYGKNRVLKLFGLAYRAMQLAPIILREKPALAVSHGSRSQVILSKFLRVPTMQIVDYEHARWLPFFKADWIMAPEVIPDEAFAAVGARLARYPGIKEDVYVPAFRPEPGILRELGIGEQELVVTVRPPATEAHYHNPKSDVLFRSTIDWLASVPETRLVLLPRNEHQADFITKTWPGPVNDGKIIIPGEVVDGLNLIWYSDLVISGGGTMNREAAALGVPVYSIFLGEAGSVDKYLAAEGRLTLLEKPEDLQEKVLLRKRSRPDAPDQANRKALHKIVQQAVEITEGG